MPLIPLIPLTPMQEMMFSAAVSDPYKYVTALRYRIKPRIFSELQTRFDLLIKRHEILRTALVVSNGRAFMSVSDTPCGKITAADTLPQAPFCLDPLNSEALIAVYLCGSELLFVFSHILLDGWSASLILKELLSDAPPQGNAPPFRYFLKWLQTKDLTENSIRCEQALLPFQTQTAEYNRGELRFTITDSAAVKKAAMSLGVPIGRLIEAVWGVLCARYAGGDALIAAADSGRFAPVPSITKIAGMFVSTLPLEVKIPENTRFCDWVRSFSEDAAEKIKRGYLPFSKKLNTIISVEFADFSQNEQYTLIESNARLITDFDVVAVLSDTETIDVRFEYNTRAFSAHAAGIIRDHFIKLISVISAEQTMIIADIDFLTDEEKSFIHRSSFDGALLAESKTPVTEKFKKAARLYPEKPAIFDNGAVYTYAETDRISDNIARALLKANLRGGVAVCLPRSAAYIMAEIGIMKAGCYFIPADPDMPRERFDDIIKTVSPALIIDADNYASLSAKHDTTSVDLPEIKPENPAYVIMTSGTSGKPKGVMVSHGAFAHYMAWAAKTYYNADDISSVLIYGFTFDGGFGSIYGPLLCGSALHILHNETRFDIRATADFCLSQGITHIDLPAAMLPEFTKYLSHCAIRGKKSALQFIITGGEQVKPFTDCDTIISNEYGPTECTVSVTQAFLKANEKITIGSELPNTKIYVLDERGKPCPLGVFGECYVAGVQIAMGYIGAEDKNAFSANPFGDGQIYKTGDRVRFVETESGYALEFGGRNDGQIKLNGFRIETGEIEQAALKIEGVSGAVAVLQGSYIALYAVCDNAAYVGDKLRETLPHYMLPVVIPLPSIPLTESGKPDLSKLAEYKAENSDSGQQISTPECEILCDKVFELIGVKVGEADNFLSVGGNSVTAMKLSFTLAEKGINLSPPDIIRSKNFAELASKITDKNHEKSVIGTTCFTPPDSLKSMIYLSRKFGDKLYTVTAKRACNAPRSVVEARIKKAADMHDILRCKFSLDSHGNISGDIKSTPNIRFSDEPDNNAFLDPLGEILAYVSLGENLLTLRYHHIILDGYSVDLLLSELAEGIFPETAQSYSDFVNAVSADSDNKTDHEFYENALQGCEPVTLFENKNPPEKLSVIQIFDAEFSEKIHAAARKIPVTPAIFIMAAFGVFLSVYGGINKSKKTIIPVVASFRNAGALLGCAAQTFPVAFFAEGDFNSAAIRLRDSLAKTIAHINIPEKYLDLPYIFVDDNASQSFNDSQNYGLVVTTGGRFFYDEKCVSPALLAAIKTRLLAALTNALSGEISAFAAGEFQLVNHVFPLGKAGCGMHDYLGNISDEKAFGIARSLKSFGIGPGDCVMVEETRHIGALSSYAGISLSGAAFLPVDADLPQQRKDEMQADCRPSAMIKNGEITLFSGNGITKRESDTAYVIYTSGTTGKPKGVPITKQALQSQINWTIDEFAFSRNDIILHYINFAFDPSVWVIYSVFASGAGIKIVPEQIRALPDRIADFIAAEKITIAVLPAAAAYDILDNLKENSLRLVFLGGDKINIPHRTNFTKNIEIINLYGPTETCINASFYRLPNDLTSTACIGKPIANTNIYILDSERNPLPIGIRGEIYIGGDKLSQGYINRPAETASAFIVHAEFGRLYKTGDIAAWNADGSIEFFGRNDRQVKIRGFRVELSEIEAALSAAAKNAAAVIYKNGVLTAFVCGELPENAILSALRASLPSFMIPNRILKTDKLPLTANGKIDYSNLTNRIIPAEAADSAPLGKTEKLIAEAFEEVLSLPAGTAGRNGDFFALGGHSLKLFALTGALASRGLFPGINDIMRSPVVVDLAEIAEQSDENRQSKAAGNIGFDDRAYDAYITECENADISRKRESKNIMITGATGFLGAHLLREIYKETSVRIFLPVRGETSRIRHVLDYYFPGEIFDFGRFVIFSADISEKQPEVQEKIDIIYHSAADIRHYAPPEESYKANVTATEHMIGFAQANNAYLAHISTASAVNKPVIAENDFESGAVFENIYQKTKQKAERIILASTNLRYGIFRVGNITPSRKFRVHALNSESNSYLRLLTLLLKTRTLPDFGGRSGYCFADDAAKAIALIAQREFFDNHIYHITNPNILTFRKIFAIMNIIESTDYDNVPDELRGIYAQRAVEKKTDVSANIRNEATLVLLRRLGFVWDAPDLDYLKSYTDVD
jgi:amino acid adenylation domain-containing protein